VRRVGAPRKGMAATDDYEAMDLTILKSTLPKFGG
jgi:hypothetical protein